MDNFIDKLAKRFNAGEIIKANAAAEERELQKQKERAAEYERMMQEMRRLNLKNIETTEQVSQLIKAGIEGFEEYDKKSYLGDQQLEDFKKVLMDTLSGVEELSGLKQETDKLSKEMSYYRTEIKEEIKKQLTEVSQKLEQIEQSNKSSDLTMALVQQDERMSNLMKELLKMNREISDELVREGLAQLKEDQVLTRQSVLKMEGTIAAQTTDFDALQKNIEEFVHKENVKVYRNVQAVVVDQTTQKTREISDQLNDVGKAQKSLGFIRIVAVLGCLFALATLILEVYPMILKLL